MRRICSKFIATQTSSRLCLTAAGTSKNSTNDQPSANTHTINHRKNERRKPADTFGTLSSFGKKLLPFKMVHGPKQASGASEEGAIFEEDEDGEDVGWTSSFLRSKFRESNRELPVITEPVAFGREQRRKLRKKREAEQEYEKLYGVDRSTSKVLIDCARKEYNHYEGMRYPPGNILLASTYWVKSKYKNDWFTIHPVMRKNPSFNRDESFSWDENVSLLDPVIIENARKLGFRVPTVIQRRAFRAFKSDAHLLIAAETGSGKTAAYAAPLLSALLRNVNRHAKGVVLVPTHALRMQTSLMISKLAEGTNIKIVGGSERWRSEEDWDILVSTPSFSPEFFTPHNIDYIVLDEADMLLDDSFLNDIIRLLGPLKIRHSVIDKNATDGVRLIFSSATYPDQLQLIAESIVDYEYLYCVKTENLHRIMPHIKQTFIRIREIDKLEKLKELLEKGLSFPHGQTLIFCKNLKNVGLVSRSLREMGIEHTSLSGGRRIEQLIDELRSGAVRIIIATDVASRGLDLPQLRHIINYDFPRQISDYVHRCGRIGRIGSLHKCLMTSFVRRAWEVKHVNSIELAARLHRPLQDVELNDPARLLGLQRDVVS
ncbi:DEAD/DEAH box helicase [Loa loa]|uniref:RNA helicase n=1 Tax=Loa loa TaxID=7209 RepID=A0A1I7VRN4_LOALO|nr:DEAD/DEAH box helicase [Loa loa]EFO22647.1 DEAD/DEAH box helicase [Loa loa]